MPGTIKKRSETELKLSKKDPQPDRVKLDRINNQAVGSVHDQQREHAWTRRVAGDDSGSGDLADGGRGRNRSAEGRTTRPLQQRRGWWPEVDKVEPESGSPATVATSSRFRRSAAPQGLPVVGFDRKWHGEAVGIVSNGNSGDDRP